MKRIIFNVLLVGCGFAVYGQQDFQLTHYMFDRLSFNPAVAGTDGKLCFTGIGRTQWTKYLGGGSPKTALLNAQVPLKKISSGLGLTVYQDKLGFTKDLDVKLSYSFHRKLGPGVFGAGVSIGLINKSIDGEWVSRDPIENDVVIGTNPQSSMIYDLGLGVYYTAPTFYLGLSSDHLTEVEFSAISANMSRHYYVLAGYNWAIGGNQSRMLKPSILAKSDGQSTIPDINVMYLHNNLVWFGVTYRLKDAIAPMVGINYPVNARSELKIGYSYDITTSSIRTYSSATHELMVNYCMMLRKKLNTERYRNVRFL